MLTEDGIPKITDFGLAKLLESPESLTHSGAILGTPSYMAPEQARGLSREICPATDVHALGAILYEMFTGHPPFKGATPISTLEQVATQEPIAPGKLLRHLPRDLETICLKCLEKEPRRRYGTALELADDLNRFRAGRPILARPVPIGIKIWKWARRKPSTATALLCGVLAVGLVVIASTDYNARLRGALRSARTARIAAEAGTRSALEQRNLALKALNQLVYEVQETLAADPNTRPVRRGLLDTAISGLDAIAQSAEASAPDLSRAVAHQKLGEIFRQIGRAREARRQLEQSINLAERLAKADPRDLAVAECLYAACYSRGELNLTSGQPDAARDDYLRVVKLAESIAGNPAADRLVARRGQIEAYLQLGRVYNYLGAAAPAETWFHKMHDLAERWVRDDPLNTRAKDLLAISYRKLADVRKLANQLDAARDDYLRAIDLNREILAIEPLDFGYKTDLAVALEDLAGVESRRGQAGTARALFHEAEQLFGELAETDPENLRTRLRLARTENNGAALERAQGRYEEAARLIRRALAHLTRLAGEGRLDDRPDIKFNDINKLRDDLAFCEAAPLALKIDSDATLGSLPVREAARLLAVRVRALAEQARSAEARSAAGMLCQLEADSPEDLLALADALAASAVTWKPCAERALQVLETAVRQGRLTRATIENDPALAPIHGLPAYRKLVEHVNPEK